ncbi:MAG: hypothetical protein K2N63_14330, partial [Lachnospiraceae bacterium]|nr:hypothetical protein [Lachnospiraceae bacterium]
PLFSYQGSLPRFLLGLFCCLSKQLLYITTPLRVCQQLFSFFLNYFFFCEKLLFSGCSLVKALLV